MIIVSAPFAQGSQPSVENFPLPRLKLKYKPMQASRNPGRGHLIPILLTTLLVTSTVEARAPAHNLYNLVEQLASPDPEIRARARDLLIRRGELSITPALVDSVFFNSAGRRETVAVLEHLLGEKHGPSFNKWIETIGRREDIVAAPGYMKFKSRLFARIDPALAAFLREDAPRTIRPQEIVWGGVKKDGIPALDHPDFIDAASATWMTDDELVFGVSIKGDVRAYPERILAWHEMVNDIVGEIPVSLSYCTLCGSAILYDGRASHGKSYTFGSSGFLYRSNKLMYDRQTQTLWSQLTGEPVLGPLVSRRIAPLRVLPLLSTTWREWLTRNPGTRVLSLRTGHVRDYRPGAAYGKYLASPGTMFPVWKKAPDTLEVKEWVLVVNVEGSRKIYPIDELQRAGLVHDRIGVHEVVLVMERAYFTAGRRFRRDGEVLEDQISGERFLIGEEELVSPGGTRLKRLPAHRAFWFGAYAFYPGTEVWRSPTPP